MRGQRGPDQYWMGMRGRGSRYVRACLEGGWCPCVAGVHHVADVIVRACAVLRNRSGTTVPSPNAFLQRGFRHGGGSPVPDLIGRYDPRAPGRTRSC
jgi:hypothetical protein